MRIGEREIDGRMAACAALGITAALLVAIRVLKRPACDPPTGLVEGSRNPLDGKAQFEAWIAEVGRLGNEETSTLSWDEETLTLAWHEEILNLIPPLSSEGKHVFEVWLSDLDHCARNLTWADQAILTTLEQAEREIRYNQAWKHLIEEVGPKAENMTQCWQWHRWYDKFASAHPDHPLVKEMMECGSRIWWQTELPSTPVNIEQYAALKAALTPDGRHVYDLMGWMNSLHRRHGMDMEWLAIVLHFHCLPVFPSPTNQMAKWFHSLWWKWTNGCHYLTR